MSEFIAIHPARHTANADLYERLARESGLPLSVEKYSELAGKYFTLINYATEIHRGDGKNHEPVPDEI